MQRKSRQKEKGQVEEWAKRRMGIRVDRFDFLRILICVMRHVVPKGITI